MHAAQHGATNRAIAAGLGISSDGVKFHIANALGKLGLKNKAALKSWFSTPKASALARSEAAIQDGKFHGFSTEDSVMSGERVSVIGTAGLGQVSRTVKSLVESIEFYQEKLGIPHLYSFGDLAFFDIAGTRLFLSETKKINSEESILYFNVTDIKQSCDALEKAGVEISNQPHLIHTHEDGTEEWMAFLIDPEGRPLGLMSRVKKQE